MTTPWLIDLVGSGCPPQPVRFERTDAGPVTDRELVFEKVEGFCPSFRIVNQSGEVYFESTFHTIRTVLGDTVVFPKGFLLVDKPCEDDFWITG